MDYSNEKDVPQYSVALIHKQSLDKGLLLQHNTKKQNYFLIAKMLDKHAFYFQYVIQKAGLDLNAGAVTTDGGNTNN